MKRWTSSLYLPAACAALIFTSCQKEEPAPIEPAAINTSVLSKTSTAPMTVFATGLNNPRGLKFGPDGYLYVAEGGLGGTNSTRGQCDSVIAPVGPYTGGMTGRISKISPKGEVSTVADNLPSDQTSPMLGSLVSGVADVEFIGNKLYALLAGAGCSHGNATVPNSVVRVNRDGSWSVVANLSEFLMTHHVAQPEADDFEPDGTWYSMLNIGNKLFALEPNHGELDMVDPFTHTVSRVVDVSASFGHIVPTAIAFRQGDLFVGNLRTFPVVPGSSSIYRVDRSGSISVWATGFTTVLGLAFDRMGNLYVLENSTVSGPEPTPGTGAVLRLSRFGVRDTIATGLFLPTAMTIGPDGNLYISNKGFGPPIPGFGEIVRVDLGRLGASVAQKDERD